MPTRMYEMRLPGFRSAEIQDPFIYDAAPATKAEQDLRDGIASAVEQLKCLRFVIQELGKLDNADDVSKTIEQLEQLLK